jgi:hypothetical protein
VEALSGEVARININKTSENLATQQPENPAYINLKTQIATTEIELKRLLEQSGQVGEEIRKYERRIESAPLVEKGYQELLRDYNSAREKYNEISNKLIEARVAQGMEESQVGERFTIIDPAQFPEKPDRPNRIAILIIGLVLSMGAGVGVAALREAMDTTIKTPDELLRLAGVPVLSVVPLIKSRRERRSRQVKWGVIFLCGIGALAVSLFVFDQFVMPLDILWVTIQRRMMKGMVLF